MNDIIGMFKYMVARPQNLYALIGPVSLAILFRENGYKDRETRLALASHLTDRDIRSFKDLRWDERAALKELVINHEAETKRLYYTIQKQLNKSKNKGEDFRPVWVHMPNQR